MKWAIAIIILIIISMSLFSFFKKNITPVNTESNFIIVTVRPGVDPSERESRYGNPIHAILEEKGVGKVTGGGTMLNAPDENNKQTFEFSDIEIEMTSHEKQGLEVLFDALIKNNFPENTEIMLWDSQEIKFANISDFRNYLNTL